MKGKELLSLLSQLFKIMDVIFDDLVL